MKIEEIQEIWDQDAKIDEIQLGRESLKIPQLHAKYYRIYLKEKVVLLKLNAEYRKTKLEKFEFLINPTQEKIKEGWKVPPQGKLLKPDVAQYLDGDDILLQLELRIGLQQEKIEMLKSILDTLKGRGFLIKNYIDHKKWIEGG